MHHRARDLTGLRAGYLEAIRYAGSDGRKSIWTIRCDCGKEFLMPASEFVKQMKSGHKASCGCMRSQTMSESRRRHGMSHHPAFGVWHSMKQRCTDPRHHAWKNYGGRGITVCDRWLHSFENFWADMGPTWQKGMDLDRRDNDAGYSPENCRWVSRRENCLNRRRSVFVDGKHITDWARETGIGLTTLYYRLAHGCPREHLFDKPNASRRFSTLSTAAHGTASLSTARRGP